MAVGGVGLSHVWLRLVEAFAEGGAPEIDCGSVAERASLLIDLRGVTRAKCASSLVRQ